MRYNYNIQHVPGKLLYTADTLSRAPQTDVVKALELQEEMEASIETISDNLPDNKRRLETYQKAQSLDGVHVRVKEFCNSGWPEKRLLNEQLLL